MKMIFEWLLSRFRVSGNSSLIQMHDASSNSKPRGNSYESNDVYCDNEYLRGCLLDAIPYTCGLYNHEIIALFYCSFGDIVVGKSSNIGTLKYAFSVKSVDGLIESLIMRKYIRENKADELIHMLSIYELRDLMRNKQLKCKGTSSRENMKCEILKSYTYRELRARIPKKYFVPTEKGIFVMQNHKDVFENRQKGWGYNSGHKNKVKNKNIEVHKLKKINKTLFIDTEKRKYLLESDNGFRKELFNSHLEISEYDPIKYTLKVIIDNEIFTKEEIRKFIILQHIGVLILEDKIDDNKSLYIAYDFNKKKKLHEEISNNNLTSGFSREVENYNKLLNKKDGIAKGGEVNYFVSVNDYEGLKLLEHNFGDRINIIELPNILQGDASRNIRICVKADDTYSINIINYMIKMYMLDRPVIKGVPLSVIMRFLVSNSKHKTTQLIFQNNLKVNRYNYELIEEIRRELSTDWRVIFDKITKIYPNYLMKDNPYRYYRNLYNEYENDEAWEEVRSTNKWETEFREIIQRLRLEGIINVRWNSELALYRICKTQYEDSIFQYHSNWLGRQSLDIFIPSLKFAIEYQGIQHYEPVEIFGGETGFKDRQKLDERKRKLCIEKDVILHEWHYSKEINVKNFNEMILKYKLN